MNKRQNWTDDECEYFLKLLLEKKVIGLMDGKRLRTHDIFKTLEEIMKNAGFVKDTTQMQNKFKNLKGEYYKCKRHNGISGNDSIYCKYYELLNELLENRPAAVMAGFDHELHDTCVNSFPNVSTVSTNSTEETTMREDDLVNQDQQFPILDINEPQPSCSKDNINHSTLPVSKKRKTKYEKTLEEIVVLQKGVKDDIRKTLSNFENDVEYMETYFNKQEKLMKATTKYFLKGMKSIFTSRKRRRDSNSSSSSSRSSDSDTE